MNDYTEVRRRLDAHEKEFMLVHVLRLPTLFADAKNSLKPEDFDLGEDKRYALVWAAALEVAKKHNGVMPESGARIRLEIEARAISNSDPLFTVVGADNDQIFGENGFITWAYDVPDSDLIESDGRLLLSRYLEECTVVEPLRKAAFEMADAVPTNMAALLGSLSDKLHKIKTVQVDPCQSAFPDDWEPTPIDIFPTGLSFFDQMMDGGQAPGEVYLLLGGSGVGKSTCGVKIAVEGSLYQTVICGEDTASLGHWFYFTYEAPVSPELRLRVWSYAARIHRDSLWKMRKLSELSTTGNLKPYEIDKYEAELRAGHKVAGERERLEAAKKSLKHNLWLVDMSGGDSNNPNVGNGGVEEIAQYLKAKVDSGVRVAGYVIDYAGIAVDRFMGANNVKLEHKRQLLAKYPLECLRLISSPFNASGWVIHQLSGAANAKSPTARQHHTDAAECKTMADNTWFAFELGMKDLETSTCQITCSKTRRAAGDAKQRIVHINGAFCDMTSADGRFSLDVRTKRIVQTDELRKVMSGIRPVRSNGVPNPASANLQA